MKGFMKKHLTNSEIISFLSDKMPDEVALHLKTCAECREKSDFYSRILKPSRGKIAPSSSMEKRILDSYDIIINSEKRSSIFQGLSRNLIFRISAAAAVIVVIASASLFLMRKSASYIEGKISLSATGLRGRVLADNRVKKAPFMIKDGSVIKTGERSSVDLAFEEKFSVRIDQNSIVKIDRASFDKKNGIFDFVMNVRSGSVTSVNSDPSSAKIVFLTPNARVRPEGASFLLTVSSQKTVVSPSGGSMKIVSLDTGKEILSKNGKYIVTSQYAVKSARKNEPGYLDLLIKRVNGNPVASYEILAEMDEFSRTEKSVVKKEIEKNDSAPRAARK